MELSQNVNWQQYCQSKNGTYQKHVREACRLEKDQYAGAHGFRGNYVQELEKTLEKKGIDTDLITYLLTHELGHERRSMTRHYRSV